MPMKVHYCDFEGVRIPKFFSKECFESTLRYQPKPEDIFVVTYPKCGTTWMQNVVLNILRRGEPLERPQDFFLASPFLDQLGAEDSERLMISPGAYKTHLPFEKVPWSDDAKYIYVTRNPKDCCVSFYHHMRQFPTYQFSDGAFDDFFELFISGNVEFGDYFDHFISWNNQKHRSNIFFTTYEEMKNNLENVVLKVAEFINTDEAEYLQNNPNILAQILHNCSLQEMKFINSILRNLYADIDNILKDPNIPKGRKYMVNYIANLPPSSGKEQINFIRKGEIGGWKTVFTADQNKRMNARMKLIEHCTDTMSLWEKNNVI